MDEELILKGIVSTFFQENTDDEDFLRLFETVQTPPSNILPLLLPLFDRKKHNKPKAHADKWIERIADPDFHCLFRMTKMTFNNLLSALKEVPDYTKEWSHGLQPITTAKKTYIGLMYLSSLQPMRKIGETFKVADSTVTKAVNDLCAALCILSQKYIQWPNAEGCLEIAEQFQTISNFPGIVGAMDICQIDGKFLKEVAADYINPKSKKTTIILQGVCTANKILTNIYIGPPAGPHDVRALNLASLSNIDDIRGSEAVFKQPNFHLIGSSVYPLKSWLMVPFRDNGCLSDAENNFNSALSKSRVVIENVFGLLKGRWKRLYYIDVNSVEKMRNIIRACCVLHNFCLLQDDHSGEVIEEAEEQIFDDVSEGEPDNVDYAIACAKRNNIMLSL